MNVRISRWTGTAAALVVLSLTLGCGGGSSYIAPPGPSGPPVIADFYVDASGGSDTDPGTWEAPFKTITHALSVAVATERIHAVPGTYDTGGGEVFPLVIPDQVELIGDEPNKGAGGTATILRGGALVPPAMALNIEATVVTSMGSTLAGFVVNNPNPYTTSLIAGVACWRDDGVLRNCHVVDCVSAGVYFGKVCTGGALTGNVVARNGTGMSFGYGPDGGRVEANVVTENVTGIWFPYGEPDLGGGSGGSTGGNYFVLNTTRDLQIGSGRTIAAQANYWDAAPPAVEVTNQVTMGIDVFEADNTVTLDTTGALLNTETFTIPTFP